MPRLRLTDTNIEKVPFTESGTVFYLDTKHRHLQLGVGQRTKTFYLFKYHNRRNRRIKLGRFGEISAGQAAAMLERYLGDLAHRRDPKKTAKGEPTLSETVEAYIERRTHKAVGSLSLETAKWYRRYFEMHCKELLDEPVSSITSAHVEELHWEMRDQPYVANRVSSILKAVLAHGKVHVELPARFAEQERDNNIVDRAAFFEVLDQLDDQKRAFWYVAILTGIRRDSILTLDWDHLDLEAGTITLDRMKNRQSRVMALSTQAIDVLRRQEGLSDRWVFPSMRTGGRMHDIRDKSIKATPHDCRRTFTEVCVELLLPEYIIDYLRGDTLKETRGRYVKRPDPEAFREPTQRVSDRLLSYRLNAA